MTIDPRKRLAEAWRLLQSGRPDLATATLREAVEASPQNAELHVALGIVAANAHDVVAAIGHMREALRHEPRLPPALTWLAVLYFQTGDYAQAEKYAVRGLLANPENIECLKVLGQCNVMRGDFDEALALFDKASRLQPRDPEARFAKGTLLRKLNRESEALTELEAAVQLATQPRFLMQLADVQLMLGRAEESIATSARVLALEPASFPANMAMARALTSQERVAEAEEFWAQSEALEPSPGMARFEKASSYIKIGKFSEAQQEARQSIELGPQRGGPYYLLVASKRVTPEEQPLVDRIEQILANASLADEERVHLLYALGKAYDNLGDYERAMRNLDSANAIQRRLVFGNRPFDRDAFRRGVDNQIAAFSRQALSPVGSDPGDLPLFILGMMRSGTTLIDQILTCHPQVGSAGEQGFWLDHEGDVVDYPRRQLIPGVAEKLKREYVASLSSMAPGSLRVIDKNPGNVLVAGMLHALFPSSRIFCTRRHAVDTALSIWMTHTRTAAPFVHDRSAIVFAYKECLRLMDHWLAAMPPSRYLEVRYESLIDQPEAHTREMVAFCGLDWTDACLHPENNTRAIRTPSFWQARQPVYRTSVDRWRRYEGLLGPFEELIGL